MSLFQNLLNLHVGITQEENFFTEIFVSVLKRDHAILKQFLSQIVGMRIQSDSIRVESQVYYPAFKGHEMGSRPDVVIRLYSKNHYDVVIIESKLGSREGKNQLDRYAIQAIKRFSDARHRYLLYITRSYDPKDETRLSSHIPKYVKLVYGTWSKFYSILTIQPKDSLVDEMMAFMEENGMAENNKLYPADLASMNAFPRLIDFMQSSLEGEVEDKFRSVLGCKPKDIFGEQARFEYRMVLWGLIGNDLSFLLGYFFDKSGRDYPQLGLLIEIPPKSPHWSNIAKALKSLSENPPNKTAMWDINDLDHPENWTSLFVHESLSNILGNRDHLQAIRKRFIWYLDQVAAIKKRYPSLPWKSH